MKLASRAFYDYFNDVNREGYLMTSMQTNGRTPIDIESQYDAQALMDQQARDLGTPPLSH